MGSRDEGMTPEDVAHDFSRDAQDYYALRNAVRSYGEQERRRALEEAALYLEQPP